MDRFNEKTPHVILAVILKNTGQCIGFAGIGPKEELDNEIELGYMISEGHRNLGYATEAAKAMVWWAFERGGQDFLSAIVAPENKASRHVIEKLGFVYGDTRTFGDGGVYDYFRLYNTDALPGPVWDLQSLYKPEKMGDFFNVRAGSYNEHMYELGRSGSGNADYITFGECFPETGAALNILDVGCGTGIELDYIWRRAPNAHITCLDMSRAMLELLLDNHPDSHHKMTVIEASFVDWVYPAETYDIVTSHAAMHHFWPDEKIAIYRKILMTLRNGGQYIEGDFVVDPILAEQYRKRYEIITAAIKGGAGPGEYHIDIPCTLDMQIKLLQNAGFSNVEVLDDSVKSKHSGAIFKATK